MATTPAVGAIFEAKFFCTSPNQNGINVLHYQVSAITGAGVTDADIASSLSALAGPLYRNWLPTTYQYAGARIQVILPSLQPGQISTSGAAAGSQAFDPIPNVASGLVTLRTQTAGRAGRGRVYLPFWSETHNDATQKPTGPALAFMGTWATALINPIVVVSGGNSSTVVPIVLSGGLIPRLVTSFVVRTQWATQRRRASNRRPDALGPGV